MGIGSEIAVFQIMSAKIKVLPSNKKSFWLNEDISRFPFLKFKKCDKIMAYLRTVGLENFRLFKERTLFDLAPITILTGINNSGKSSLIKSLQLMQSSIQNTGDIDELAFSKGRHNLGHYGLAINEDSESGKMTFTFDLSLPNFAEDCSVDLVYQSKLKDIESARLQNLKIYSNQGLTILQIEKEFDEEGKEINIIRTDLMGLIKKIHPQYDEEYFEQQRKTREDLNNPSKFKEIFSVKSIKNAESIQGDIFNWFYQNNLNKMYWDHEDWTSEESVFLYDSRPELSQEICHRLKTHGIRVIQDYFVVDSIMDMLKQAGDSIRRFLQSNWRQLTQENEDPDFSEILILLTESFFSGRIPRALNEVKDKIGGFNSLSSVRANSERLYFNNSEIVDINQLLIDFSKTDLTWNKPILEFIERSLKRYDIGDKIEVNRIQGIASEIFVTRNGKKKLLADMGFGYTQLIPIILKIALQAKANYTHRTWDPFEGSTFLLEEPESNLHPSYQSKLAELIIDASRSFNIQFIIETHSEYMIRNFQYLTAIKTIPANATKIYYFNHPESEDFKVEPYRHIQILEDGRLSNEFGEGFFDEIPRLLAFLYNSNSN